MTVQERIQGFINEQIRGDDADADADAVQKKLMAVAVLRDKLNSVVKEVKKYDPLSLEQVTALQAFSLEDEDSVEDANGALDGIEENFLEILRARRPLRASIRVATAAASHATHSVSSADSTASALSRASSSAAASSSSHRASVHSGSSGSAHASLASGGSAAHRGEPLGRPHLDVVGDASPSDTGFHDLLMSDPGPDAPHRAGGGVDLGGLLRVYQGLAARRSEYLGGVRIVDCRPLTISEEGGDAADDDDSVVGYVFNFQYQEPSVASAGSTPPPVSETKQVTHWVRDCEEPDPTGAPGTVHHAAGDVDLGSLDLPKDAQILFDVLDMLSEAGYTEVDLSELNNATSALTNPANPISLAQAYITNKGYGIACLAAEPGLEPARLLRLDGSAVDAILNQIPRLTADVDTASLRSSRSASDATSSAGATSAGATSPRGSVFSSASRASAHAASVDRGEEDDNDDDHTSSYGRPVM